MNKTAHILRNNISEIMEIWQEKVKKDVPAAKYANAIALYDHLPNIINDIADIMERHHHFDDLPNDTSYSEILENSVHHGRHRATTTNYTVEQVVHEYIIFHRTLSEFIALHTKYNEKTTNLLKYIIETSILKSVGSFSLSLQEMQEKLIGTIAHDIRNPLSAAQLALEMIRQDKSGKWTEKMLVAADRSVRKALGLIEGLMNGITVKAGEGMLLDFEEIDVLKDIQWVHAESLEVYTNEIILTCDAATIHGIFDSTAVRRLLENLIGNAVKYGFSRRPITISIIDDLETVELRVHNYGNAIPIEKQEQIFNFMDSAEKDQNAAAGSWGMGLTLTQIVAEAHGGDINLISNEEDGTTFIVTLLKQFNEPGKKRAKLNFVVNHS